MHFPSNKPCSRAVASLTVPGSQEFHFPHFFLKFWSIFLIFPQTLLISFLILALRGASRPPGKALATPLAPCEGKDPPYTRKESAIPFTRTLMKGKWNSDFTRGGRKRLPKFKFSAKFPIGLHVILQIQIKNSKMTAILCEKLF